MALTAREAQPVRHGASVSSQLAAIILRDLRECVVNPAFISWSLAMAILPAAMSYIFGSSEPASQGPSEGDIFIASIALFGVCAMTVGLAAFVMADEWEQGALPSLLRAGVSPATLVAGHALAGFVPCIAYLSIVYLLLTCAPIALPLAGLPAFLLAAVPITLLFSLLALSSACLVRHQRDIYSLTAPVTILMVLGIVQGDLPEAFPSIQPLFGWLPTTLSNDALRSLVFGLTPMGDYPADALAWLAWMAVGAIALAVAYRRYKHDIAALTEDGTAHQASSSPEVV